MKKQAALLVQLAAGLVAVSIPALAGIVSPVPEPSTILLLGGGLGAVILVARWKRSKK